MLIYTLASAVLVFAIVGLFMLIVLTGFMMAFPMIGGIKAKEGLLWRYPLTIPFFK